MSTWPGSSRPGSFGTTEEWRYFNALHYCSVMGLRPYQRAAAADGLDRDARRAVDWFRRYVPRRSLRRWQAEGATMVAAQLWRELVSTDPRWLTGAGAPRRGTRAVTLRPRHAPHKAAKQLPNWLKSPIVDSGGCSG